MKFIIFFTLHGVAHVIYPEKLGLVMPRHRLLSFKIPLCCIGNVMNNQIYCQHAHKV